MIDGSQTIEHWSGRLARDLQRALPKDTEAVVIVLDRISHALARKVRAEAGRRGLPISFIGRKWSSHSGSGDGSLTTAGTAEGAALCYRTICREAERFLAPHAHPEITMHSFSLRSYLELIDGERWEEVAVLLSQSSVKLSRAGADFIVCPNNTLHRAFDAVPSPIPWLHIAEVVATEAFRRGSRRVGLLGTRSVMEGDVYRKKLERVGIDLELPYAFDQVRIHAMILTEMIRGHLSDASRYKLYMVIKNMKEQGCDAVILGCTELPLFVTEDEAVLPLLDSPRLLAQAAIRHAIGPRVQSELSPRLASHRQDWGVPCAEKTKEGVFTE